MKFTPIKKKLPAKYNAIAFPLCLSVIMSCLISFVATVRAVGFVDELPQLWLNAWVFSWCVAFPTVLTILPFVRKFVSLFVEAPNYGK
jgi:hypothetical protein